MSEIPDNAWLLTSIEKMNRSDLLDLCFTRGEDFWRAATAMTVPKIRDLIRAERRLHLEGKGSLCDGRDAPSRKQTRPRPVVSECQIPASEVNAFLRSLPRPESIA